MSFIQNIKQMVNKKTLTLIESYQEAEGVYTFVFKKPKDLHWKAGQHGFFTIHHKVIEEAMRPFSISSAAFEEVIKISVGINNQPSEFKESLLELKKGMTISMRGPVGPMYLTQARPTMLIAGGIGITPFRAILKDAQRRDYDGEIILNYLDSKGVFAYRYELEEIAQQKGFTINYLQTREELYDQINAFIYMFHDKGSYYLAGPKMMVNDLTKYLRLKNIKRKKHQKGSLYRL